MAIVRNASIVVAAIIALIVTLSVCLICMGLLQATQYYALNYRTPHPRVLMSEARESLKAGDVLLFIGDTQNFTNSFITKALYSHAGIVVRGGDTMYAAESVISEPYMEDSAAPGGARLLRKGTNLVPLADRLEGYCGQVFVMPLNKRLPPDAEDAMFAASAEDYPYPSTVQAFMGIAGLRTRSRHCFQHVARLIDTAGLQVAEEGALSGLGMIDVVRAVDHPQPRQSSFFGGELCRLDEPRDGVEPCRDRVRSPAIPMNAWTVEG